MGITNLPPEQQAIRAKCFHPTGTFVEFPKEEVEQSIPDRFEKIVRQFHDRIAVKTSDGGLSYEALNKAANRIAAAILNELGDKIEPVMLFSEQSLETIISCLGILKAGKILVAIDPSSPIERLGYILDDSQAAAILTGNKNLSFAAGLAKSTRRVINIDAPDRNLSDDNTGLLLLPDAAAELRYSSGSMGQPKGIVRSHRRILYAAMLKINEVGICPDDRLLILRNVSFGGKDIFKGLLSGAGIFLFDIKKDGLANLAKFLIQERITHYTSVPSTFRYFVNELSGPEILPSLRMIELGGEPLSTREVELYKQHCSPKCILMHKFSSGEAGNLCQYLIDKQTEVSTPIVPIGYPVDGKEVFLVDDNGEKIRFDRVGEIAVRSRYLSSEYWRKPELTSVKFLADANGGEKRVYLTGDMGRMLPDGCLIYLGRKDDQVKIRGCAVLFCEVEIALRECANVKDAVVTAWESESGEKFLAAYVVPKREQVLTGSDLRRFLKQKLPEYMIPSTFVFQDALPLTPGGKVDRRALPTPNNAHPEFDASYVPPRTALEKEVANIWADVLNLDNVGINHNFFDLGGHSLAATRVVSQVIKQFQVEVPLQLLFQSPTVAEMAAVIMEHQSKKLSEKDLECILTELESMSDEEAQKSVS
jgi:non-ribosomal peptide synthetase component F/acyl carrier protein